MGCPKLRPSFLKSARELKLTEQKGLCALCHLPIEVGEEALDHDHKTGHIRGVLHLGCNRAEGMVLNSIKYIRGVDNTVSLELILAYWATDYSANALHPTFKTTRDRRVAMLGKKIKKGGSVKLLNKWATEVRLLKKNIDKTNTIT